jgi:YbbR domain-containing protein
MRALLQNLPLKMASLGLAVLLWFVIAGEKTSEMGLQVPVELQNFPRDLELTGDPVDTVEVRLRASPGVMQQLGPAEISAQIDLAGSSEGERIVHLTADAIRVPFGVTVVRITPAILNLNFERTLQKVVPVRPRILGRPAPGYEVAEVVSEPAEVRIAGPKSRVMEVESAFTEALSVERAETAVVDELNIGLEDPVLRIQGSPRVRVTARVREAQEKRRFGPLAVSVRGAAASVQPPAVSVVVAGPAAAVKRLKAADLRPFVEAPGRAEGLARVAVEIAPGNTGVSVLEVDPSEVALRPAKRKAE